MFGPIGDLVIDGYPSGYSHGVFSGIDTLMNGGKQLLIDQAQGRGPEPGSGLLFELQMVVNYWK